MTATQEAPHRGALLGHSQEARLARDQRRVRVAAMLACHTPYREMAAREQCDTRTIQRDVDVLRRYWRAMMARDYEKRVAEEWGKLDALERAFTPKALLGDNGAALQLRWIAERRAKMMGSDAPARSIIEVVTEDVIDAEIRRLSEKLGHGPTNGTEDRSPSVEAAVPR